MFCHLEWDEAWAGVVRSYVPDHQVAQMMDHFTQYVGSSPMASPAVLCGIAHMQTEEGIWYPMGGTRAVPEALAKLAGELGVDIRTGVDVARIETTRDTMTGALQVAAVITTSQERIACDAVISNCDAIRTYRELIEPRFAKRLTLGKSSPEPACSGVVFVLRA